MTQDTKAVITGAGSGMGRASSLKLAEMGMNVVLVDYNLIGAEETLSLIREQGGDGIAVQADVSKASQVEAYVKQAMDQYGRIDVFFNNAGVIQKPFLFADISEEEFDRVVAVNFKGVFLGMKYVLKVMEEQGFGTIINTASTAGLKPEHSVAAYSATKHAVVSLTKSAALEYAKTGIRITPSAQAASTRTWWQASRRRSRRPATFRKSPSRASAAWPTRQKSPTWWRSSHPRAQAT